MSAHLHARFVTAGFAMAYVGGMGSLLLLSEPNLGPELRNLLRIALLALIGAGALIIAAAKAAPAGSE